ncbi:hypothetical protein [Vagococcus carniphilus]|uniref:hypothetical protein n=1 Tax=Vagococcus carniphilus TaxID=218144 RepID=UPI003BAC7A91
MKKELNQLIMQRYKYFLLGISLLIVGITILETKANLSLWQETRTELNSKKAENSFYKELKSKDSYPNGKMVVFYDDREGKSEVETDDFSEYKKARLEVFHDNPHFVSVYSGYVSESIFIITLMAIVSGFVLFFYDNKTNFNTMLFSSKYRRRDIYLTKYKIVGGTLFLTLLVAKVARILSFVLFIPSEHLNANFFELLPSQLLQVSLLGVVFMISSFAGILLGEWVTGVITIFGFWYMFNSFVAGIFSIYSTLTDRIFSNPFLELTFFFNLSKRNTLPVFIYLGLFIVVSAILFIWGMKLYDQLPLENNGKYLMFDFLRRPIQLVFLVYLFVATTGSGLVDAIKINVTGVSPYGDYHPSVLQNLITTTIALSIGYLISVIAIYRKNPFTFIKKKEAL